MRICDFVVRDAIVPDVKATTKEGVIRELVEGIRTAGYFKSTDMDDVVRAILKREQIASTGIGRGVAIPHAKHNSADRLVGTVALSKNGVAFESVDGEPVFIFFLLVSPQDQPGNHLRALELISKCLRDDGFVKRLRQSTTKDQIWGVLEQADHSGT